MQQQVPPPFPDRSRAKRSPWMGCAIGCGVFAGIVFLVVVCVVVWLMLPEKRTVPMTTLVGSNAVAVVHLTGCGDDAGVAALLGKLQELQRELQLEAIRQAGAGAGGKFAEVVVQMQHIDSVRPSQIPEVLLAVDPPAVDGASVLLVGVGVDSLPRLVTIPIKLVLKAARREQGGTNYRGMEVVNAEGDGRLALGGGLFLFSTGMQPMRAAIDRARSGLPAQSIVAELPAHVAEQWDLYALGDNREGQLKRLFEESRKSNVPTGDGGHGNAEEIPFPWEEALSMHVGVDVVSADCVKCEWTILCRGTQGAGSWREFGEAFLQVVIKENGWDLADTWVEGRVEGSQAVVSLQLVGLEALLETRMRQALREGSVPQGERNVSTE